MTGLLLRVRAWIARQVTAMRDRKRRKLIGRTMRACAVKHQAKRDAEYARHREAMP